MLEQAKRNGAGTPDVQEKAVSRLIEVLKIVFPVLMVIGAAGSMIVNVASRGDWPTSLQWLGAMLLYTALTFRNIGG